MVTSLYRHMGWWGEVVSRSSIFHSKLFFSWKKEDIFSRGDFSKGSEGTLLTYHVPIWSFIVKGNGIGQAASEIVSHWHTDR